MTDARRQAERLGCGDGGQTLRRRREAGATPPSAWVAGLCRAHRVVSALPLLLPLLGLALMLGLYVVSGTSGLPTDLCGYCFFAGVGLFMAGYLSPLCWVPLTVTRWIVCRRFPLPSVLLFVISWSGLFYLICQVVAAD